MPPSNRTDPTLHLPRLLCFHGGGTNKRIFQAQCSSLTRTLSRTYRFCYVEAPYLTTPGPDVAQFFSDIPPFKAWLRPLSDDGSDQRPGTAVKPVLDAIKTAIEADEQQGATGEWLGVLGFSQGAKICASLLYTQQYCRGTFGQEPLILPSFCLGVLSAGRSPLGWLGSNARVPPGLVSNPTLYAASKTDAHAMPAADRLRVPTLHVHGLRDPSLTAHRELVKQCCDSESARVLEWDGVHSVPLQTLDVRPLAEAIIALAKTT